MHKRAVRYVSRVAGLGLSTSLFVLALPAVASAAGSVHITGTVTNQSGSGIQNVSVTATVPGGMTAEFGPSVTAADGSYQLDVDPGTYDFNFVPPGGSGLNSVAFENFAVSTDQVLSVQMTPITHTWSGTVRDQFGQPVKQTTLFVDNTNVFATTDNNGHYSLSTIPGTYSFHLGNGPGNSRGVGYSIASNGTVDLTAGDVVLDVQLEFDTLTINVKDGNGAPLSGVTVQVQGRSGGTTPLVAGGLTGTLTGVTNAFASATLGDTKTDANGALVVNILKGTNFSRSLGATVSLDNICALMPAGQDSICLTAPITIAGDTTVNLVKPITHTWSGTVRDQFGQPVKQTTLFVDNTNVFATTDNNGHYSLSTIPGTYSFHLGNGPGNSRGVGYSIASNGTVDLTAGDVVLDVQLEFDTLTINVKDGNGAPLSGVTVQVQGRSGGTTPLVAGGLTGTLTGVTNAFASATLGDTKTDANGALVVNILKGTNFSRSLGATVSLDNICALMPAGQDSICLTAPITIAGDTTVNLVKPITHTWSGTVRDQFGQPVKQTTLFVDNTNVFATTDNNGHYSLSTIPGTYSFHLGNGPGNSRGVGYSIASNGTVDLTAGDVVLDVQLEFDTLTINVKDGNGAPLSGVTVQVQGRSGGTTPLVAGGLTGTLTGVTNAFASATLGDTKTDANGALVVNILKGTNFSRSLGATVSLDNICALMPAGQDSICLTAPITIAGDTGILLQPQPAIPDQPTGLSAVTPTRNSPALTWNPVSGPVNYRVFRDSVEIGTTASPSFVDSALSLSGSYSYTVQAVNAQAVAGVSSAPFIVVYDIDSPAISYDLSPVANVAGWNKGDVTVTFSCTDGLSGVASCTAPVTLVTEGGNQTVTGTTVDNAGNSTNVTATVSIDKTAPVTGAPSWGTTNPKPTGNSNATVTLPVSDALSGVAGGEYFVGTDPGVSAGTAMTYATGNLSASLGAGLPVGVYDVGLRAKDVAGNWSPVVSTMLVVYDNTLNIEVRGKNKKDLAPSLAAGDIMPGLVSTSQNDKADYGFTVAYRNGVLDSHNDFHFDYAANGHTFALDATSFAWLVIDGTNNSRGSFQGVAHVTVDGITTVLTFTVTGIDGDRLTPASDDHLLLKIYTDDSMVTVLYQASGSMAKGQSVTVK